MTTSSLRNRRLFTLTAILVAVAVPAPAPAQSTPAATARRPLAITADSAFWRGFHAGAWDSIPQVLFLMKAAYLQNPSDAQTAAHIGFLHAWRIAERSRASAPSPTIIDEATLARRYFEQARRVSPAYDARHHGFSAVFQMIEANIHGDSAQWQAGLADGRRAVAAWPEFNWFSVGYTLSGLPVSSPLFAEAIDMQWKTVDACAHVAVDRQNPTVAVALAALAGETDPMRKRACSNSWIAPHNVQGFFLNMGDMIVKKGDPALARRVYALARDADGYESWPYASILRDRMRDADVNVERFRSGVTPMMFSSRNACTACHQSVVR